MAEELYLDVKTNIGQVTEDTKDYKKSLEQVNEEINLQTKYIIAQEKELIKLKAKQDAIPKGGWVAGMDKLNDKIKETTADLNLEKNALKGLQQEQKEATKEVKKHKDAQKENNKQSKESIADFKVMGVSLNGVKKGFSKVIPMSKAMFGTIKAGIISTGIGALVIGVMALIQSFKRSEKGQEKFQLIMAAIGAVTSQVLDLFAGLGETIVSAFEDPKQAITDLWEFIKTNLMNRLTGVVDGFKAAGKIIQSAINLDWEGVKEGAEDYGESLVQIATGVDDLFGKAKKAVTEFTKETLKEIAAIEKVTKARQKAHHIDRELKVERAKANREINELRLQAEDREKYSADERIKLLRKAQKIEQDITDKEIKSKKILIDAQISEMEQGLNTIEQKDELAQLQADAIELDTKRLRGQRLLQTQITTALNEVRAQERQDALDRLKEIEDEKKARQELYDLQIAQADALQLQFDKFAKDEKNRIKSKKDFEIDMANQGLSALATAAGEGTALAKAAAIAQATISGVQGVQNAFTAANANIGATAGTFGAYPVAMATLAGTFAAINIAKIASGGKPGGGGGASGGGGVAAATPAPQMMSGAFDISGGVAPEPTKAYVVTDEMSNSQNQLANIRRRATI